MPAVQTHGHRARVGGVAAAGGERERRRDGEAGLPRRAAHGAARGAIAAMAMTGLREFTRHAGLLEEPPPEAIVRQKLLRVPFRGVKQGRWRAQVELLHWSYGAVAGLGFALLPRAIRRRRWAGPAYGLLAWTGFELALAPALGLSQARRARALDRAALLADHLLYGLVLSETRRPRGDSD